jgi:hypothetical protein
MLELQQRPTDDLGAVATLMDFSARRLDAGDMREPVRNRQERIVTLLDKLIEEAQQREQQQSRQPRAAQAPQRPRQGAEESRLPPTAEGRIGQLNRPPQASPGEAWGKLPPAEREEILQSLRERYPSRYRHLVEQYYRALADEE